MRADMAPDHQAPAWVDRSEYPFESRFMDVPGGQLHYIDEGQGDPIVFVHGVPTWSFNYRHLVRRFAGTHRCVAMDHLGFGLSSRPAAACTAQQQAANVERLIDGLGLTGITLVVHDWGGPLGLSYAIGRPANVRRLVILNTWCWASNVDLRSNVIARLLASPAYRLLERFNFTARMFIPRVMADRSRLTPEAHRHYIEPLRRRRDRMCQWELIRGIRHSSEWLGEMWGRRETLGSIPTVIIWGMKDKAFSVWDLRRWREALPDAGVCEIAEAGHFPQEETPDEVAEALDAFLGSTGHQWPASRGHA